MKRNVIVSIIVEVKIDETKFNEEFLSDFKKSFYNFPTVERHFKHLPQLTARGCVSEIGEFNEDEFIEGYGPASDMGIKTRITDVEIEIE